MNGHNRNPVPRSSYAQVEQAAKLYKRFTGMPIDDVRRTRLKIPKAALVVGTVDGIMYTTVRDDVEESYIHEFRPTARPLLAVGPDGKTTHIIGGDYVFTERGFVDGPKE